MNCENLIAMCAKTHLPCPHARYDGHCDEAKCSSNTLPTFRDMVDIYKTLSSASRRRIEEIESVMRRLPQLVGLEYESKVVLGENEWELIYNRMRDGTHPYAHEGGYSPDTIKAWFDIFHSCCGLGEKRIRLEYKRRNLTVPETDYIPEVDFSLKSREVEELTDEQYIIVTDRMTLLRKSKKEADTTRFLYMFFYLFFGVRPADIFNPTWSCIKQDPMGGWRFEYIPHKTAKKTNGRPAGCAIHPRLLAMIKPYVGDATAYVIPRHTNRRQKTISRVTHGELVGYHSRLRAWLNGFMRKEVGVKGTKASYLLRRNCAKWALEHKGVIAEGQLLGHTPKVMSGNYVNIHRVKMRDGIKV